MSIIESVILLLAFPSPYGFVALLILSYTDLSVNNSLVSLYIVSSFVPASFNVPASIPSGLSVVSLSTRTGFPSPGASS